MQAQPFAFFFSLLIFLYLKIPQFCLQFWMTQNQAEVILAFFLFGALMSAQIFSFIFVSKSTERGYLVS